MNIRQWLKRHFAKGGRAEIGCALDGFARCSSCGRTYDAQDLHEALPHFEHELGLGAEPVVGSQSNERLPTFENVVPLARASSDRRGTVRNVIPRSFGSEAALTEQ